MDALLRDIRSCTICQEHLPLGPRPVVAATPGSRIVVIGQAPGRRVHETGIAWNDPSGDRLRDWLGVDKEAFYNPDLFALMPMAFCYPGTGKAGDLPPRKECAPAWHGTLLQSMKKVKLTLLIGNYAQNYYLPDSPNKTLTEKIRHFRDFTPQIFVLPHPSPRNNIWLKKNPWFALELLPELKQIVGHVIKAD